MSMDLRDVAAGERRFDEKEGGRRVAELDRKMSRIMVTCQSVEIRETLVGSEMKGKRLGKL
ncbi:hypothetical protein PAXRUDRAFT_821287 [Paxillus rubicundulus Ve08.2h10]|uniref:Uncharacterized protein n=1 Tax=Paxillus rubicundulus Ve08.2h10 TaxID=930991 RepID=A0A0D0DP79_9AGAM|nr:hypothetical protein PAXRUDRAFT_821287 [Paxillus rubicundulus Ve08.2h10]